MIDKVKKLSYLILATYLLSVVPACRQADPGDTLEIKNGLVSIKFHSGAENLWSYTLKDSSPREFQAPVFELNGEKISANILNPALVSEEHIPGQRLRQFRIRGDFFDNPGIRLDMIFQIPDNNPLIRFRFELEASADVRLTRSGGSDHIIYISAGFPDCTAFLEQRMSEFYELPHSYLPSQLPVKETDFVNGLTLAGPILVASKEKAEVVLAYEHGSQIPDNFLQFQLSPDKMVEIKAVKGNYYHEQSLSKDNPFLSPWFIYGENHSENQKVSKLFRDFVLHHMSANRESRKPYIFYNTWNYQERNKNWYGNPYLHEMRLDRMLQEIDVAARMGIDVFVIDAGWFGKTGDWIASPERFPDDLEEVKSRMDAHDIKMGLWFNSAAALSSEMLARNKDNIMTIDGQKPDPHEVWETEASYVMCMVSPFSEDYAGELIRVAEKYGVRYFKWDAFSQYGCNAPGHYHGNADNSPEERAENYSFLLPRYMKKVADRICARFPDAIVDFDITEGERAVGLAFLSSGKYFAVNNGPYYYSFDDPEYAPGGGMGANVLVFPGIARAANAREVLKYDDWIPSVLFLTHYLPDEPEYSQWINIGSLILGQNGIWGDLLSLSESSIDRFGTSLAKYKQVREDITLSYPVRTGRIGGLPEIHEKINPDTGKGVVVIFYNYKNAWRRSAENAFPGTFSYVTKNKPQKKIWTNEPVALSFDNEGHAVIKAEFNGPGAKIIYFGVE